jgi:hypothetical protein
MSFAIALTDEQWEPVADLLDPPGRRGAPAQICVRCPAPDSALRAQPRQRWPPDSLGPMRFRTAAQACHRRENGG